MEAGARRDLKTPQQAISVAAACKRISRGGSAKPLAGTVEARISHASQFADNPGDQP